LGKKPQTLLIPIYIYSTTVFYSILLTLYSASTEDLQQHVLQLYYMISELCACTMYVCAFVGHHDTIITIRSDAKKVQLLIKYVIIKVKGFVCYTCFNCSWNVVLKSSTDRSFVAENLIYWFLLYSN